MNGQIAQFIPTTIIQISQLFKIHLIKIMNHYFFHLLSPIKRVLALLIFFLLPIPPIEGSVQLTNDAKIAMVTIGPYQGEMWSIFGHCGIRVHDPSLNIDWFYNYGIFDHRAENFYLNYAKGILWYQVGINDYQNLMQLYVAENRDIREQYLSLNLKEKQRLFDYLQNNVKPKNAIYRYNYVYNNCSGKLRDILLKLFPKQIIFNSDHVIPNKTIRDLMMDHLKYRPWTRLIINIMLGAQIDDEASPNEYLFLPENLFKALDRAQYIDLKNNVKKPLIASTHYFYKRKEEAITTTRFTPLVVFTIVFFIVGFITKRDLKKSIRTRWIDKLIFFIVGFFGLWITYLWFGTDHLSKYNYDLLWAFPLHLVVAFFLDKQKFNDLTQKYFQYTSWAYCLLFILWPLLKEPIDLAFVPLVLTMTLRAFYIAHDLKK